MNLDNEKKEELIKKYRTEVFENENVELSQIGSLISDDDLKLMFNLNNKELAELINQRPIDNEGIKKILIANVNLYKLAKERDIHLHGTAFLLTAASAIKDDNYNADRVYAELNVGEYNRPFKRR